jgi:hypothetical protein
MGILNELHFIKLEFIIQIKAQNPYFPGMIDPTGFKN